MLLHKNLRKVFRANSKSFDKKKTGEEDLESVTEETTNQRRGSRSSRKGSRGTISKQRSEAGNDQDEEVVIGGEGFAQSLRRRSEVSANCYYGFGQSTSSNPYQPL